MKKLLTAVALTIALGSTPVSAQEKGEAVPRPPVVNQAVPDWQSTYQQEAARDYIRRRAQEKSAARQARIEGMKWLGHSPLRPVVSTTPFMSSVPSWVPVTPTGYWGPNLWPSHGHRFVP